MITQQTVFYVVDNTGCFEAMSEMTLQGLVNAVLGGLDLAKFDITLDKAEAEALDAKNVARQKLNSAIQSMTAEQIYEFLKMADAVRKHEQEHAKAKARWNHNCGVAKTGFLDPNAAKKDKLRRIAANPSAVMDILNEPEPTCEPAAPANFVGEPWELAFGTN